MAQNQWLKDLDQVLADLSRRIERVKQESHDNSDETTWCHALYAQDQLNRIRGWIENILTHESRRDAVIPPSVVDRPGAG